MWPAAPHMKRNRKTALIGTSTLIEGTPPTVATFGGYGPGPCGRACDSDMVRGLSLGSNKMQLESVEKIQAVWMCG